MKTRDEYVAHLKSQLDHWNAEAAEWESRASAAREKNLAALRAQREAALYQLKLVEKASAAAWQDVGKGADAAWAELKNAMTQAREHFEKSSATPPKPKG